MVFPVESEDRALRNILMMCQDHARLVVEIYRRVLVMIDNLVKHEHGGMQERIDEVQEALVEALGQVVVGNPADASVTMGPLATADLIGLDTILATINDPAKHAQVVAESGPQEAAIVVAAEPVDMEHLRQVVRSLVELQPVLPVVAEVIAAKRFHGHRVTPYDADLSGRGRGRFRRDAGTDQHAVIPVLGLVDEWCKRTASAAENNGADGYARRVVSKW